MAFVYWIHLPEHTDMFREGYIGFTSKTVGERWYQHTQDVKRNKHLPLYRAISKYSDKLIVTPLIEGTDDYCLQIENKLRPNPKIGWNIKIGGDVGSLGVIPSEETRAKMSVSHLSEKNGFFGKTHSDTQKAKWSKERSGKPFSEEAMQKSRATKNKYPWNVTNARTDVWAKATEVFSLCKQGLGRTEVARLLGYKVDTIKTIFARCKNGWNPNTDPFWIEFSLQVKEADNANSAQPS